MAAAQQCIALASFLALVFSGVRYKPPAETTVIPTEVDVVVVGGGSAGAVVASRLSEVTKWQVVLLEAGPEEPLVQQVPPFNSHTYSNSLYDWKLAVQKAPNDHTGIISRAKMLGGCSAHNGMIYLRGLESDHQCWEKAGAKGWGFKEVLPFYKKSENALDSDLANDKKYHATGGPMSVQRALNVDQNAKLLRTVFKVDLNGGHDEGFGWTQTTTKQGRRVSANTAFLYEQRKTRKNLHILTEARVRKVHINAATKRAESVEYTDKKGATHIIKARLEIVLSAGTYFSPQLLMVSGIGPQEQLKKAKIPVISHLPGVGQNLQDHNMPASLPVITFTRTAIVPTVSQLQKDAKDYARGVGPLTVRGLNPMVVRKRSLSQPKSDKRPYIQAQALVEWSNGSLMPFCTERTPSPNFTACYYNQATINVVLLHPTDSGTVTLNTTDAFSPPFIYQKVFTSKQDVVAMAAGLKEVTDMLLSSKALRSAGVKVTLPAKGAACGANKVGSAAWYECIVRTNGGVTWGHGVGTCSIGSVVDTRLRVLGGVKGLRVADASVMPCVPSGNTNAPTIMVGERAADFIKKDHGVA
ncbi:glucose dehydrogenase [FAD, quinone]-like isoform X2 [Thrips palmi]|uniref:Glucose dehydrogenase [FAD, quinone]-like isoform X2 n=1 Tax=Thrips palmi TaxID=161013 RepID=A0A6P8Y467_THRPL|nr:glucose dehydrogenase [FAD, quinone]-like isoform X2 [Thrips palmi]